jgi:hypothetical protein
MDTIEEVWERMKKDQYWLNNVWDKERLEVWPLA